MGAGIILKTNKGDVIHPSGTTKQRHKVRDYSVPMLIVESSWSFTWDPKNFGLLSHL